VTDGLSHFCPGWSAINKTKFTTM